ncbi:MAG: filamentous hemagglutinin N-terminal domain-containing protein [Verrucomicrobiota bacterium]
MTGKRSFRCQVSLGGQLLAMLALAPIVVLPPHAIALPTGGQVVHGDVSIIATGGSMDITQLGQAGIVNWADFGIGAGEIVNIHQAADAALLNRVLGANPSELLGQLNASGRVFLINPNGVVVGAGASINAQEFMASALGVDDAEFIDFANGDSARLRFEGTSTASVVNLGSITANDGDAILIAYKVANEGQLTAANGVAGLAAGTKVWLAPQNAQHIIVESDILADAADGTGVSNSGTISAIQAELKAAGGNLYALAINQTGFVHATGVAHRDGRVLLTSDEGTVTHAAGTISARNADGSGGEVLVGGDYRGLDPGRDDNGVNLSAVTTVAAGATIDVSANVAGTDGGRAVVWANGDATFAGSITAEADGGGAGNGGTAIVAGGERLDFTGTFQVGSAGGEDGTILLALPSANINATGANDTANFIFSNTALSAMLGSANVVVEALGDQETMNVGNIRVDGDLAWDSGNQLTLKSGNNVRVSADITAAAGAIEFQVMGVDTSSDRQSVYTSFGATITADRLTVGQNADSAFIGFNPPARAKPFHRSDRFPRAGQSRHFGYQDRERRHRVVRSVQGRNRRRDQPL